MLWPSIAALVVSTACVCLSRSGLRWAAIMWLGAASGYMIGSVELYYLLFPVDLIILTSMAFWRQEINDWWQESVIGLQIVISVAYLVYAVFAGSAPWLTTTLIDLANALFLAQVVLVGAGGGWNGYRNVKRLRQQRKSGRNVPISTIWKMI